MKLACCFLLLFAFACQARQAQILEILGKMNELKVSFILEEDIGNMFSNYIQGERTKVLTILTQLDRLSFNFSCS